MTRRFRWTLIALSATLAGCAGSDSGNRADTMTRRQRDSVLGQTGLPGAQGINKALTASDSAKARAARIDSAP
jgi:hypothetical protein